MLCIYLVRATLAHTTENKALHNCHGARPDDCCRNTCAAPTCLYCLLLILLPVFCYVVCQRIIWVGRTQQCLDTATARQHNMMMQRSRTLLVLQKAHLWVITRPWVQKLLASMLCCIVAAGHHGTLGAVELVLRELLTCSKWRIVCIRLLFRSVPLAAAAGHNSRHIAPDASSYWHCCLH